MRRLVRLSVAVLSAIALSGCATVGSMRSASIQEGISRTFQADRAAVVRATQQSFVQMGLKLKEQYQYDDSTTVIIASEGINAVSWGVLVRVVIQELEDSETVVRVTTKRRLATNILAEDDFSQPLLWNIQGKLE